MDIGDIHWLNQFATDGLKPDLTLYFDIDTEEGLARIARNADRDVDRLDMEKQICIDGCVKAILVF